MMSCSARAWRTAREYGGWRHDNVAPPHALRSGDRRRDRDHGGDLADQFADLGARPVRHLPAPHPVAWGPVGQRPCGRRKRRRLPFLRLLLRTPGEHVHRGRPSQPAGADRPPRGGPGHEPAGRVLPPLSRHRGVPGTGIARALRGRHCGAPLAGGDRGALDALQASHGAAFRESLRARRGGLRPTQLRWPAAT